MARRRSSQAGFSLAELLVAVMILAVGLLGLAEMQVAAMHDNSLSSAALGANSIAQAAVEEIMAINSRKAQLPADENPLYAVVHTGGADQPWPTIPAAVAANYLVHNTVTVPGSGTFTVTYTTVDADDPTNIEGCPAPTVISDVRAARITVNVVSAADRFGRGRATLTTVKNCSM